MIIKTSNGIEITQDIIERWNREIKHFSPHEFDSPDDPGSGYLMQLKFVKVLDTLRELCKFILHVTSGYRTYKQNLKDKGVKKSSHRRGWGADLHVDNNHERFLVVKFALGLGVNRVVLYKNDNHVHLDMDPDLPGQILEIR